MLLINNFLVTPLQYKPVADEYVLRPELDGRRLDLQLWVSIPIHSSVAIPISQCVCCCRRLAVDQLHLDVLYVELLASLIVHYDYAHFLQGVGIAVCVIWKYSI
jgi:hypothetical protein